MNMSRTTTEACRTSTPRRREMMEIIIIMVDEEKLCLELYGVHSHFVYA